MVLGTLSSFPEADHSSPFLSALDILPRWGRFGFGGGAFSSDGAFKAGHGMPCPYAAIFVLALGVPSVVAATAMAH